MMLETTHEIEKPHPYFDDWMKKIAVKLSKSILYRHPPSQDFIGNVAKFFAIRHEQDCPYRKYIKSLLDAYEAKDNDRCREIMSKGRLLLKGMIKDV